MSSLFKTCHNLRAQQPLCNRYGHGAWPTIIPLLVYPFGDEIASSLCTGVRCLGPKPGPVIQVPAATDDRYFCSLKRHWQSLLRTEAEPVHAWQDTDAPDRPAHQPDHSADERSHFVNAPVRDAACDEIPDNQAGQHRCAKTRHLETGAGCNVARPTLPHKDDQCERQKDGNRKRHQQFDEKGRRHNWPGGSVLCHEPVMSHIRFTKPLTP